MWMVEQAKETGCIIELYIAVRPCCRGLNVDARSLFGQLGCTCLLYALTSNSQHSWRPPGGPQSEAGTSADVGAQAAFSSESVSDRPRRTAD